MTTPSSPTSFPTFAQGDLVLIRIVGPGVCRESGRFESILRDVERRAGRFLVLDLSECPRVDSTFAGAFLRLAERVADTPLRVALAGAQPNVRELLDTLCVDHVLTTVPLPALENMTPITVDDQDLDRHEVLALSLEGHERLAALCPDNARKFATLLAVLREQIRGDAPPS